MKKKIANRPENEKELVLRSLTDTRFFEQIYAYYYPKVYNYIRLSVDSANAAEDITSQVFIKVISRLGYYNPGKGEFSVWLFTIAANTVRDYYRLQKHSAIPTAAAQELSAAREFDIDEKLAAQETKEQLLAALQQLSRREQNIIALKFWADLSNRKIAQMLELSENNVAVILFRALKRLKQILADNRIDILNL